MTRQIPYLSWWLLLLLCLHGSDAVFCDPLKWEYFRSQVGDCGHCEPCVRGEGKKTPEEFNVKMGQNGARLCLPCRTCKKGTYSDTYSHKCSHCTNCTVFHMIEIRPCSHVKNSVCDSVSVGIRVHKTSGRDARQSSESIKFDKDLHREVEEHASESEYHTHYRAFDIGLGFSIAVIVVVIVGACLLFRLYWKKRHNHQRVEETIRESQREVQIQPFLLNNNDASAFPGQRLEQVCTEVAENNVKSELYSTRSHRLDDVEEEEEAFHIDNELTTVKRRGRKKVKNTEEKTRLLVHSECGKKRRCSDDCYLVNYGASTEDHLFSDGEHDQTCCIEEDSQPERGTRQLKRQLSVPVTEVERNCSPNMTLDNPDEPPSVGFNTYFSRITACNDLYKEVALDVGIDKDAVGIIYKDYKWNGIQEVAYQVAQKIAEKMIPKRKIYESLYNRNKTYAVLVLKLREIKAIHLRGRDLARKLN